MKGFSLRQRFLVAPLLGLVVCSLLTAGFIYESRRQNELVARMDTNVTAFNRYAEVFANLTERHMALKDLLDSAGTTDVTAFHERARQHLYSVRAAVRELEQVMPSADGGESSDLALRRELSAEAESYWKATRALALTTVEAGHALRRGDETNQRFTAINRSFTVMLELERTRINTDAQESREGARRVNRLNRVYAVLSGINTLIVRVHDRDELFREACRVAVEHGQFKAAMIGVLDRETMQARPVASAGAGEGFLAALRPRLSLRGDDPAGVGLVAQAVREKKPVVVNDVEHDPRLLQKKECIENGIYSMGILPLLVADNPVGVLALFAGERDFFDDEEEMKLLRELAGDIARGYRFGKPVPCEVFEATFLSGPSQEAPAPARVAMVAA